LFLSNRRDIMDIKEHMEVIGADGVHVGTVDRMEGKRIKLTKKDSGEGAHKGHHHFIDASLEHFPKRMNRAGFPCGHESDSRIVLEGRPV
jgi:hypothetical protein